MLSNSYDIDIVTPSYGLWYKAADRWGRLELPPELRRRYHQDRTNERVPVFMTFTEAFAWWSGSKRNLNSFTIRHKSNPTEDISSLILDYQKRNEHAIKYL